MLIAFAPIHVERDPRDRVDDAAYDALRALGLLTTAVNFTADKELALRIHERANQIAKSVLALEDMALTKADRLCGQ